MIEMVFAILMVQNGSVIEYVPQKSLASCLSEKRQIMRNIGEEQQGIYMECREISAEIYDDCVAGQCRTKIKRIID